MLFCGCIPLAIDSQRVRVKDGPSSAAHPEMNVLDDRFCRRSLVHARRLGSWGCSRPIEYSVGGDTTTYKVNVETLSGEKKLKKPAARFDLWRGMNAPSRYKTCDKSLQRRIMTCLPPTKLMRHRDQPTNVYFGVNTQKATLRLLRKPSQFPQTHPPLEVRFAWP